MSVSYHIACERCACLVELGKLGNEFIEVLEPPIDPLTPDLVARLSAELPRKSQRNRFDSFVSEHAEHRLVLSTADIGHGLDYSVGVSPPSVAALRERLGSADAAIRLEALRRPPRRALSRLAGLFGWHARQDPDPGVRDLAFRALIPVAMETAGNRAITKCIDDLVARLPGLSPKEQSAELYKLQMSDKEEHLRIVLTLLGTRTMAAAAVEAATMIVIRAGLQNDALAGYFELITKRLEEADAPSRRIWIQALAFCGVLGRAHLESLPATTWADQHYVKSALALFAERDDRPRE